MYSLSECFRWIMFSMLKLFDNDFLCIYESFSMNKPLGIQFKCKLFLSIIQCFEALQLEEVYTWTNFQSFSVASLEVKFWIESCTLFVSSNYG